MSPQGSKRTVAFSRLHRMHISNSTGFPLLISALATLAAAASLDKGPASWTFFVTGSCETVQNRQGREIRKMCGKTNDQRVPNNGQIDKQTNKQGVGQTTRQANRQLYESWMHCVLDARHDKYDNRSIPTKSKLSGLKKQQTHNEVLLHKISLPGFISKYGTVCNA